MEKAPVLTLTLTSAALPLFGISFHSLQLANLRSSPGTLPSGGGTPTVALQIPMLATRSPSQLALLRGLTQSPEGPEPRGTACCRESTSVRWRVTLCASIFCKFHLICLCNLTLPLKSNAFIPLAANMVNPSTLELFQGNWGAWCGQGVNGLGRTLGGKKGSMVRKNAVNSHSTLVFALQPGTALESFTITSKIVSASMLLLELVVTAFLTR